MAEGEGKEEHQSHQQQEERKAPETTGDNVINTVCEGLLASVVRYVSFFQSPRDEAIAGISDERLGRFLCLLLSLTQGKVACGEDEATTRIAREELLLNVAIALK